VPHRTIAPGEVEREIARFEVARERACEQITELQRVTARQVGEIEAKVFDPQLLMLEDPELVDGTVSYIRENFLSAERAFDWRLLEFRFRFLDSAHHMVVDRLADLQDIRFRVLSDLHDGLDLDVAVPDEPAVLLFRELTPSFAVGLDPERVLGVLTMGGTRAAHSAIIARTLDIPAVVGIGTDLEQVAEGTPVIMDGSSGRVVVDPTAEELEAYERLVTHLKRRQETGDEGVTGPSHTRDGARIRLAVNLDAPDGVRAAVRLGAEGVGLFRSEFLVIGRRVVPSEDEQYQAYRTVVEAFPEHDVTLRTFDIGGDKFPLFLDMQSEENPYLGWRGIRVCLDRPDLFRKQLRAAVRAGAHGALRLLIPFVVSLEELLKTREMLQEVMADTPGDAGDRDIPLGVMVETPAVVETLDLLAPHVDFASLGTNDLTQYVLAADRGNVRLAHLADPLHPALFRIYDRVRETAVRSDLEIMVCGDLPTDPIGLAALIGLGYRKFSIPTSSFPEVREIVRSVSASELERLCDTLRDRTVASEIRAPLADYVEATLPADTASAVHLSVGVTGR
jgi:phosphotransferase system enzyme I (PtsI)